MLFQCRLGNRIVFAAMKAKVEPTLRPDQLPAYPATVYSPAKQTIKAVGKSMNKTIFAILTATALAVAFSAAPVKAEPKGYYEVTGVEDEDMLKMRAGPGIGYRIVVGLPNGTILWVQSCERSGNTSWCRVSLKQARGLKGYVSSAYLRKM